MTMDAKRERLVEMGNVLDLLKGDNSTPYRVQEYKVSSKLRISIAAQRRYKYV